MGENRLQLKADKTEWLWVYGALGSASLTALVLDGGHTALDRPCVHLGNLDS